METANTPLALPFPKKFPIQDQKPSTTHQAAATGSKILPFIRPKSTPRNRPAPVMTTTRTARVDGSLSSSPSLLPENHGSHLQKFPAAGAVPYVPIHHYRVSYHGMAPPVTMRTAVPAYATPPLPPPSSRPTQMIAPAVHIAPPVLIRPAVPVFAAPPPVARKDEPLVFMVPPRNNSLVRIEEPPVLPPPSLNKPSVKLEETGRATTNDLQESTAIESLKQLKMLS